MLERMALSFGMTVMPDPPYQRFVDLMKLAEDQGFDYGWTYDSHVNWQEPYPLLTLAAMNTERLHLGLGGRALERPVGERRGDRRAQDSASGGST